MLLGLVANNHAALQPDRSSLFAAYAILLHRHTWKNCQQTKRQFSVNLLKLQRGSQAHSICVQVVMKRLLILLFFSVMQMLC